MKKYFVCVAVIFAVVTLSAVSAFSQDAQAPGKESQALQAAPAAPAVEAAAKVNELAIYGEVQVVNIQTTSMSVQYYDYDNDEEKTLEISLDKDSKLENVKTIDEVKKGDWVDITYVVSGGKNIAKMVSVEKEEPSAEDNAPVDTAE